MTACCKLLQAHRVQHAVDSDILAQLNALLSSTASWRQWPGSTSGIARKVIELEPLAQCFESTAAASQDQAFAEVLLLEPCKRILKSAAEFFEVEEESLWLAHQRIYISEKVGQDHDDNSVECLSSSDVSLDTHVDECFFSFVVTLSRDFEGGGTYFYDNGTTLNSSDDQGEWQEGDAVMFGGGFRQHTGQPITAGARLTWNGFVDFHPSRSEVEDMQARSHAIQDVEARARLDFLLSTGFSRPWASPRLLYNMDKLCNIVQPCCACAAIGGVDVSGEESFDLLDVCIGWRLEAAFNDFWGTGLLVFSDYMQAQREQRMQHASCIASLPSAHVESIGRI